MLNAERARPPSLSALARLESERWYTYIRVQYRARRWIPRGNRRDGACYNKCMSMYMCVQEAALGLLTAGHRQQCGIMSVDVVAPFNSPRSLKEPPTLSARIGPPHQSDSPYIYCA